jgi:hypothetical protein
MPSTLSPAREAKALRDDVIVAHVRDRDAEQLEARRVPELPRQPGEAGALQLLDLVVRVEVAQITTGSADAEASCASTRSSSFREPPEIASGDGRWTE